MASIEAVNDLIREAREIESIRARLIQAERSGSTGSDLRKYAEAQADRCYEEFFRRFEKLGKQPFLYQAVDDIRE